MKLYMSPGRLFLDTEFNGLGGELISMALVSDKDDRWYEVVAIPEDPTSWVAENVLPVLNAKPIGKEQFRQSLETFLRQFDGCEIIADWPADFEHLLWEMTAIAAANGFELPIECAMLLMNSPACFPEIPHNALSDALALRESYKTKTDAPTP